MSFRRFLRKRLSVRVKFLFMICWEALQNALCTLVNDSHTSRLQAYVSLNMQLFTTLMFLYTYIKDCKLQGNTFNFLYTCSICTHDLLYFQTSTSVRSTQITVIQMQRAIMLKDHSVATVIQDLLEMVLSVQVSNLISCYLIFSMHFSRTD